MGYGKADCPTKSPRLSHGDSQSNLGKGLVRCILGVGVNLLWRWKDCWLWHGCGCYAEVSYFILGSQDSFLAAPLREWVHSLARGKGLLPFSHWGEPC